MMPAGGLGRIRCGWSEGVGADGSIFVFFQRYFIRGLTLGAVKG